MKLKGLRRMIYWEQLLEKLKYEKNTEINHWCLETWIHFNSVGW